MAINSGDYPPTRFRAAKACQRCNQKRVKCDAMEKGTPCTRCQQSDHSQCILVKSRRGTYARKKARLNDTRQTATTLVSPSDESGNNISAPSSTDPTDSQNSTTLNGSENEAHPLTPSADTDIEVPLSTSRNIALSNPPTNPDLASPESAFTDVSTSSSYNEISWTAMFDRFLDSRRRERKDVIDKCSITYLGESFPLSLILADLKEGGRPRLHHPGPPLEEPRPIVEDSNQKSHPSHILPEDISFLEAKKAFEYPATEILEALMSTFLDRIFPLYPIVIRQELLQQHKNKTIPWILLHSLCFNAATFCPIAILHRAGFAGRKQARFTFYRKAKALFDIGYEMNKVVILQSVILLTFWGGGPNNYWNFYSWIGTGVTIAETLGIHRSLNGTNMSPQDKSLLRRLWWVLVIRDASCGALVGRPFRINMEQCDTEMLTIEDFEHDAESPEFANHPQRRSFGLYQIHVSKLSLILREIVATRFNPGKPAPTMANLNDMLESWRQDLPRELNWSENDTNMSVFASCLSILYNHHIILAHLGSLRSDISDSGSNNERRIPETAAHRISSLACSIVTRSYVLLMPHETFQGLFLAQVVFFTQMKSSQHLIAQLGRTALNNCQLVLHDAKDAWDPSPWVMKLFDNLISNIGEDASNNDADLLVDPFGAEYHLGGNMMALFDAAAQNDSGHDLWNSNPNLSTFFSMSNEAEIFSNSDYSTFPQQMGGMLQ